MIKFLCTKKLIYQSIEKVIFITMFVTQYKRMNDFVLLHTKIDRLLKDVAIIKRKVSMGEAIVVRKKFIPEHEAMTQLQKSKKTLQIMRRAGAIRYTSVNGRNIQYDQESIDELLLDSISV